LVRFIGGGTVIDHAILVEDDSFCVYRGYQVIATVKWTSISEIVLLKREGNIRETIGLEFRFKPGDHFVEVDEEVLGFDDLVRILRNHFPGFDVKWRKRADILSTCRFSSIYSPD